MPGMLRKNMKHFFQIEKLSLILLAFMLATAAMNTFGQGIRLKAGAWGDQLNGSYRNPIINADYSDPDVIRVGDRFYMVCSEFHFMGMPVLESADLVNWHIIGQVYRRLDINEKYDTMERYGGGSWAPSLRYHNGKFYVFFCTPDEGLYMTTAKHPGGPWAPLHPVKNVKGWEDPCPFWDDNGSAYLGHSRLGAGPIILHRMSADGRRLLDSGKIIYQGPAAEGTKFYKRNGFYYLIIPEGGVSTGYETALRSHNIYGPYERRVVLEQGSTKINGPHQGGLVELRSGESWFLHFRDAGAIGRVCFLEPVKWVDNWPFIGVDNDGNGIGEPVADYSKPSISQHIKPVFLQTSDQFNQSGLGPQWQWNHNPVGAYWSVNHPKGYLALQALAAVDNKHARNTLTQKLMGRLGVITTLLVTDSMASGHKAGLCLLGNYIHEIGVVKTGDSVHLYADNNGKVTSGPVLKQHKVFLRIKINLDNANALLLYSFDGDNYRQLGVNCELSSYNYWKAVRPALFSYNTIRKVGKALFDWFHYSYDGTSPYIPLDQSNFQNFKETP